MRYNQKLLIIPYIIIICSLLGNIFAISYYFGQKNTIAAHLQQLPSNQKKITDHFTYRDLILSLSPEGQEILSAMFKSRMQEMVKARQAVVKKQLKLKFIIEQDPLSEEKFKNTLHEISLAQDVSQETMRSLFADAVIQLSAEDRRILANNFRKATFNSLANIHSEKRANTD